MYLPLMPARESSKPRVPSSSMTFLPTFGKNGSGAIPQKSPCTCSLGRQPLLTQLIELCLGLSQGSALHAETLAMRSKALPFLCQVLGRSVTQGIQDFGLCRWPGEELPGALALQHPLRLAPLPRGPQQAAPRITEVTFELIVNWLRVLQMLLTACSI
jgi:hypothetical protein